MRKNADRREKGIEDRLRFVVGVFIAFLPVTARRKKTVNFIPFTVRVDKLSAAPSQTSHTCTCTVQLCLCDSTSCAVLAAGSQNAVHVDSSVVLTQTAFVQYCKCFLN